MPLSYENYTGDNATTQFSIPFTYQNTTEISVTVDGVAETGLTFPSSSTVQLTSAPATGAIVQVRRTTDLSARAVDFASGSVLTEEDLDDSAIQTFHAAQEAKDVVNDTITLDTDLKWDADNKVIKDVANPVNLQDAATKNYIENTWLTTSDKAQLNSLNIANLNSVATNLTDVNTVATNISDVNAFAQVYRSGATDPTTSLDVGDLFYNTTSNLLKIWNGSSWETGVAGASGLLPLAGGTMTGNIAFSGSQTVDGRDVSADGNKLDNIEANADVTDAANVNPLVDAHLNTSTATVDQVLGWTGTDYDWVDNDTASGDLLAANNLSDLTNTTTARANLGVAIGSDVQAHSSVLDGTTASFTTAEESKLAGIEASATADQTGAEIKAAYEAEANTNAFTDAEKTKLTGIEIGATADQTNAEIRAAVEAATDSNVFTDVDHSKLNAIEAGATADQTGAEIKAAYEAEANAFTDAQFTKLAGIEAGATADQTASEIRALVESATDSNVFTDADHTKLNGIEASADVTDVTNVTAAGALMDSEVTNLAQVKSFDSSDYATAAQGTTADAALPRSGGAMTGAITTTSTFDGRDVATDGAKLDGIEAGATADQTAAEIRTLVESATDSNVFTDADHTKLNDISVELYGENPVSATAPSVVGNNAIAIGSGSTTSGTEDGLAIGTDASAAQYATAIGRGSTVTGQGGTAIGAHDTTVNTSGAYAVLGGTAVGNSATASGLFASAFGQGSNATGTSSLCLGEGNASGGSSACMGINTNSTSYGSQGTASVAIGNISKATNTNSIAIGNRVWNTTANQISIGHGGSITGTPEKVQISESYTLPTADGTNGQVMTTDGAGTVSFTTVSGGGGISNVVEDITPQLGGDLQSNGNDIVFADNDKATFGSATGGDLQIYHDGSNSIIEETGTGSLYIKSNGSGVEFRADNNELMGKFDKDSGARLYFNNSSKMYTTATGVTVQGTLAATAVTGDGSGLTNLPSGGSPDLFDESYDGTSTAPSATGTNSVAIGKGSTASGQESMAVLDGNAVSQDSFSLGGNVYANAIGGTQIGKGGIVGGYGFAANYAVSIGYQAVAAKTESIALGKGYSGGTSSFAAQITNNTSSYGATGNYSIAMGQLSKATQTNGVAIGRQCSSLSSEGVAIGNASSVYSSKGVTIGSTNSVLGNNGVGIGTSTYVSATYGMAFGFQSRAFQQSQFAFAAGNFASFGDAQGSMYILRCATTDATPTVLTTNGGASANFNQIEVQTDQCLTFDGTITAMQNGAQSYASWRIEGLLVNDGGTTTVANSAITVIDNQSSWGLTLTADNTNNALAITFTGEAAHNIRTVANIRTSEVTYA